MELKREMPVYVKIDDYKEILDVVDLLKTRIAEIKVVIYNSDLYNSFVFHPGFKIAQLVLEKFETPPVEEVPRV